MRSPNTALATAAALGASPSIAHWNYNQLVANGEIARSAWEYIRRPHNGNTPLQAVNSTDMRCNSGASSGRELGTSTQANTSWQEPEGLVWAIRHKNSFLFTLPAETPPGEYLLRAEGIALHAAHKFSCEQRVLPIPPPFGWGVGTIRECHRNLVTET